MAFGDAVQTPTGATTGGDTSISVVFGSTPTDGNLLVCGHMTGDGTSNGPTGWTEELLITNSEDADECGIYAKIASSDPATATCTSGASDEATMTLREITGSFAASPVDIEQTETIITSVGATYTLDPGTTSATNTYAFGFIYQRDTNDPGAGATNGFTMFEYLFSGLAKQSFAVSRVYNTATAVTTNVTVNSGAKTLGGMVLYKEDTGGAPAAGTVLYSKMMMGVGY